MAARRMTILVMAVMALSALWAAQAHAGAVTYTYDAAGRLVRAAARSGIVAEYAYDSVGNRESLNHLSFEPSHAVASLHLVVGER